MIPLPAPIAGVPFDLETAAGRVTAYRLGEGRTVFGDHPRFTDPVAADALIAANDYLERITIEHAGDLPQLEQPDETAAVVDRFLA